MPAIATDVINRALDWVSVHPFLAPLSLLSLVLLYKAVMLLVIDPRRSPLEQLPGPPKPGKFFDLSHIRMTMDTLVSFRKQQELRERYGKNMKIQGFGYWDQRLLTFDTRALTYILTQATEIYPKAWQSRRLLSRLLGDGVAITEGEQHKRQRRVINPAFAPQALRRIDPIFQTKAQELRDRWATMISTSEAPIDVNHWLGRATFDAFALAGFSYDLQCIQRTDDPLYMAYRHLFDIAVNRGQTPIGFLEMNIPWLSKALCWTDAHVQTRKNQAIIEAAGNEMLKLKREAVLRGSASSAEVDQEKFPVEKDQKDILSLLIKSNLAETSPKQRLSDAEILAQIHSFLFVGSDSVSLAINWTLHYLSLNTDVQSRLRASLLPGGDASYLDKVVKESLRLAPPVQGSMRVAAQDDVIPTESGEGIPIRKGQFIHLPFEGMNLAKEVWGDDAWEFNPDRWTDLPETAKRAPGLVSSLMTFSMGSHSCPGAQFAIMEMKAFISTLIPAFEFLPAPEKRIAKINAIVTRPYVWGEWEKGTQLPMVVRPYVAKASATT